MSGVVLAVHGKETTDGDFLVLDVLEAGLPPQKAISVGLSKGDSVFFFPGYIYLYLEDNHMLNFLIFDWNSYYSWITMQRCLQVNARIV